MVAAWLFLSSESTFPVSVITPLSRSCDTLTLLNWLELRELVTAPFSSGCELSWWQPAMANAPCQNNAENKQACATKTFYFHVFLSFSFENGIEDPSRKVRWKEIERGLSSVAGPHALLHTWNSKKLAPGAATQRRRPSCPVTDLNLRLEQF